MKRIISIYLIISLLVILSPIKAKEVTFNVVTPSNTFECYIAGNFNNWNLTDIHQCTKIDSITFTVTLNDSLWVDSVDTSNLKYLYLQCACDWSCIERSKFGEYTSERKYQEEKNDTVLNWATASNYSLLEMYVKTPPKTKKCYLVGTINSITGIPNGFYELDKYGLGVNDSVIFTRMITPDCRYETPLIFSCGRSLDSINTEYSNEGNLHFSVKGWKFDLIDFIFNLYFQDSKGNKDTLTLGYDTNASETFNLNQDEVNIINEPLDSLLDVRISNIWQNINYGLTENRFQTKRFIVKNNSGGWFLPITIDLYCKNWPITLEWDSTKFMNECNVGSLLTSFHPGGWFDVGGGFITVLSRTSSILFNQYSEKSSFYNSQYYYVNDNNDSVYVFWQAFGDARLPKLGVEQTKSESVYCIYPNPATDHLTIKNNYGNPMDIQIIDITGRSVKRLTTNKTEITINMENYPSGLYSVRVNGENHMLIVK